MSVWRTLVRTRRPGLTPHGVLSTLLRSFLILMLVLPCLVPGLARAQTQAWPAKPIRVIEPFAPGGALDIIARAVAQRLQEQTGQPTIVESRAGAAGAIGSEYVARSAPDGYTLLLGATTTHGINPVLYPSLPYDAVRDFAPVTLIATIPHVIVVNPALPITSMREFIAWAKAHPGMAYGSAGSGSPHHLAGEMLKSQAGLDLTHVPYKGSGPAMADVVAGQLGFMSIEITAAASFIKSGRLRAIAVAAPRRVPGLDLAPVAEAGLPGFEVTAWYALFAPAQTPRDIVLRIQQEVTRGLADPQTRERLASLFAVPVGSTPEELAEFQRADMARWARAVKSSGARPD